MHPARDAPADERGDRAPVCGGRVELLHEQTSFYETVIGDAWLVLGDTSGLLNDAIDVFNTGRTAEAIHVLKRIRTTSQDSSLSRALDKTFGEMRQHQARQVAIDAHVQQVKAYNPARELAQSGDLRRALEAFELSPRRKPIHI